MSILGWLRRWIGLFSVGGRRSIVRATVTARQRVRFTVLGVVVAVALLVIVTGLGLGLATGTTVYDDDVDYWIVPDQDGQRSSLVSTDGPQFADVHPTTARLRADADVDAATPVLSEVLRVQSEDRGEYVLVVGVVGQPGLGTITGVETAPLTRFDPHFGNGSYDGTWTGEAVLSAGAADLLAVEAGDPLTIGGNDSFAVTAVHDGDRGVGDVPTAVVQLSELQSVTGASDGDRGDQIVVSTNEPGVRDRLAGLYPSSTVQTRSQLAASSTLDSGLPLALAVSAFAVALVVGTLFVVTTASLELVADSRQLATMSAIGLSSRSQLGLVGTQTLVTTVVGGVIGSLGGFAGIRLVNEIAVRTVTTGAIAVSHPLLIAYGIGVSVLIGLFALPFLLLVARRLTGGVPQ